MEMVDLDAGRFTVAVFQDVAWAAKGLDALKQAGFPAESLSIAAKVTLESAALIERTFGSAGDRLDLPMSDRRSCVDRWSARCRERAAIWRSSVWRGHCAVS